MPQNVQPYHPSETSADVFSSLICIQQIPTLDAVVISWMGLMKDPKRIPGGFALPADLERAMAPEAIGLVKRVCTYAIHITGLSSGLVHHGLALCSQITIEFNEQDTQAISFDVLNKKRSC
jgi:hypothetical protein